MANTGEIVRELGQLATPPLSLPVLIPNMKGLNRFLEARGEARWMDEVSVFTAASEGFSIANSNCSIKESLSHISQVCKVAQREGLKVRGYISCVAVCPFDGRISPEAVGSVAECLFDAGCYEVSLGDTIGAATPGTERQLTWPIS